MDTEQPAGGILLKSARNGINASEASDSPLVDVEATLILLLRPRSEIERISILAL
jgi:hypothetical protein